MKINKDFVNFFSQSGENEIRNSRIPNKALEQNSAKSEYFTLFIAWAINIILLGYLCATLSISAGEARIFYGQSSFLKEFGFLHELINGSFIAFSGVFGSDLALRLPFLLAHSANVFFIYKISKQILPTRSLRLICACVFMYLPGVMASAVSVNSAVFIVLVALIAVFLVQNSHFKSLFVLLVASIFVSQAFLALYVALFFYGLYSKNRAISVLGGIFAIVWLFIFDFDFSGKPKGYLIDTMAVFGAVFSPFVFIYFIYSIYHIWVKESKDFLWFISTGAFCICLVFSVRSKPPLELFLPFCVIFVPHMVRLFFSAYSVRLPRHRLKYKLLGVLLISSLALNSTASIFSDFLYAFLKKPSAHFAFKNAVAKELAAELKSRGIKAIKSPADMRERLLFYGIDSKNSHESLSKSPCKNGSKIDIKKQNISIASYYICKFML